MLYSMNLSIRHRVDLVKNLLIFKPSGWSLAYWSEISLHGTSNHWFSPSFWVSTSQCLPHNKCQSLRSCMVFLPLQTECLHCFCIIHHIISSLYFFLSPGCDSFVFANSWSNIVPSAQGWYDQASMIGHDLNISCPWLKVRDYFTWIGGQNLVSNLVKS